MEWYTDLCEYYNVSPSEAIELSTRKTGRRPNLPGSKTCSPVSGKTFEELWNEKPRETIEQKMQFYKDIGSWQSFRQCNYRSGFNYGKLFFPYINHNSSILEYGCGVAPLTNYIIEHSDRIGGIENNKFCIVDVAGEHLEFAKWRIFKKCPNINIEIYEINSNYMFPRFKNSFNIMCIMDVIEHLPNPYDVINNLYKNSNPNAILIETWVNKSNGKANGPDLKEAEEQKNITMNFINDNFDIISGNSVRIYRKKCE